MISHKEFYDFIINKKNHSRIKKWLFKECYPIVETPDKLLNDVFFIQRIDGSVAAFAQLKSKEKGRLSTIHIMVITEQEVFPFTSFIDILLPFRTFLVSLIRKQKIASFLKEE